MVLKKGCETTSRKEAEHGINKIIISRGRA
jgi:hypothetical protein